MASSGLKIEVIKPSALAASDIAAWHAIMEQSHFLQRAFFAPEFALACERAHGLARVAVFRENGSPVAFFPFQFASHWHRLTGAGERIGGGIADHTGLVAPASFYSSPLALLRAARLNAIFITHLPEQQKIFKLAADEWRIGHVIDLRDGGDRYFQQMSRDHAEFVNDTRRRLRRAEKKYGPIEFVLDKNPTVAQAREILGEKRRQYERTGAGDVFGNPKYVATIESLFNSSAMHCRPVISALRAGGNTLARHLGLMSQSVLSYWFPVYDTAARDISPGRLLLWHTIESAREHGIGFIDRGEGDSRAKQEFSTGTQRFGSALWHRGVVALPARIQFSLQWRLQQARRSLQD